MDASIIQTVPEGEWDSTPLKLCIWEEGPAGEVIYMGLV